MLSIKRSMSPLQIGNIMLSNRIVFPATVTNYAYENGIVSEPLIEYYKKIAESRIGLTIVGATSVSSDGRPFKYCTRVDGDEHLEGLSILFKVIKDAGSTPAIQVVHAGRQTSSKITGVQPVAPSAIPCPFWQELPRKLDQGEIERIEDQFAEAAIQSKLAGAELIEFMAGHGYLINEFFSSHSNHRKDIYGGSLENRARFMINILAKTREKVGEDFPLICRISADELVAGGMTLVEAKDIALLLEENGMDIINVSGGVAESRPHRDEAIEQGKFLELAKGIKEAVQVPVIAVGKIMAIYQAEKVLKDGVADLVAICRAIIADPELIPKTVGNRVEEIQECIGCGECGTSLMKDDMRMRCNVNENWGSHWEFPTGSDA
jgi:2,4-dienoyl-CoA reductase-like NADH-dependent reductase (Old Yellow Enzyme family)